MKITTETHRLAEVAWTELQRALWRRAPEFLPAMKPSIYDTGGALVSMMAKSDALELNRVLGLGTLRPAREAMIDEIIGHYRAAKLKRFCLFLSPAARPVAIRSWLDKRGFVDIGNHIKLFRSLDEVVEPERKTKLDIRTIGPAQGADFARIVCKQYGWHEKRIPWLASMVGQPGFEHWMAFDRSRPVATGALYVHNNIGVLAWGSTETPYRRQGAQTALIAARVRRAREHKLAWVTVETTEPVKGRPSMSFRNLVASGFSAKEPIVCLMWKAS